MVKVLRGFGLDFATSLVSREDLGCVLTLLNTFHNNTHLQRSRRIWLIDRQSFAIGMELRANVGDWIRHRLFHGVEAQSDHAQTILNECSVDLDELRRQWELQRESQLGPQACE